MAYNPNPVAGQRLGDGCVEVPSTIGIGNSSNILIITQ